MSIYSSLRQANLLDSLPSSDIGTGATRTVSIAVLDTPDGEDPLVGLSYTCDFRSEEETGAGQFRNTFTATAAADSFIAQMRDTAHASATTQTDLVSDHGNVVVLSTSTYGPTDHQLDQARAHLTEAEAWAQGVKAAWTFERERADTLRQMVKHLGLTVPARATKKTMAQALAAAQTPTTPHQHAAWFHYGDALILPRHDGAYGLVVDRLIDAAHHGTLIVGGIGRAAFGTGLTLFDSRDLGPQSRADILETTRLYNERMDDLKPVATHLKTRGHSWYFLGNPTVLTRRESQDPQVHYWLNGASRRGETQPYGWYTLDELREEKFIEDVLRRAEEKVAASR